MPSPAELQAAVPAGRLAVAIQAFTPPLPAFGPSSVEYIRKHADSLDVEDHKSSLASDEPRNPASKPVTGERHQGPFVLIQDSAPAPKAKMKRHKVAQTMPEQGGMRNDATPCVHIHFNSSTVLYSLFVVFLSSPHATSSPSTLLGPDIPDLPTFEPLNYPASRCPPIL